MSVAGAVGTTNSFDQSIIQAVQTIVHAPTMDWKLKAIKDMETLLRKEYDMLSCHYCKICNGFYHNERIIHQVCTTCRRQHDLQECSGCRSFFSQRRDGGISDRRQAYCGVCCDNYGLVCCTQCYLITNRHDTMNGVCYHCNDPESDSETDSDDDDDSSINPAHDEHMLCLQ